MKELRVVGTWFPKIDAAAKVTGRTLYADDLSLPRMLHARMLRSHLPHGTIERLDLAPALAVPGVAAALRGTDLPVPYGILPVSQDEHALCMERVRFVGDPIAAVAAETEAEAAAALERIDLELRPLPVTATMEDAVRGKEARIHDYGPSGNVHREVALEFGDVEKALAGADHVREDHFFYGGNTHLAMEQHATLADWSPNGRLTVWSSTQTPHYLHRVLARVLGLPAARIRVIAAAIGGGFGGKTEPFNHEIVVAKLAMMTGRPVKIALSREEVFYCHRGRHPTAIRIRTGVAADGAIRAMHVQTCLDGGAYGSYGVASTFYTGVLQTVTYPIPNYRFDGVRLFTNKAPCGPKRGHGTPQGRFALEVQIDKIAEDLHMDPAALRRDHLLPAGSLTANHLEVKSIGLARCLETVVRESGWESKHGKLPLGRGVGIACSSYLSGAGLAIYWNRMPHSAVTVKLDRGGGIAVFCGSTDVGQGSDTVLAAVVAEVLGVPVNHIRVVTADTDLTPVDLGSYSSRVTFMTGNAALQAAERARDLVAAAVAMKLERRTNQIVFADGRVFDAADPDRGVSFAEAVVLAEARGGTVVTVGNYTPPPPPGKYKGSGVGPSPAYSYTAAVAEVEVDVETGLLRVETIWAAHDIGRAINRQAAIGQVEGGVYMGLGEALMEEMTYRPRSSLVNKAPSLLEYKSPTALEMCTVEAFLVEEPDPRGPFGAKEVGQGPLLPVPPAVANAVYDAVGVRIDEIPITPEKILAALEKKRRGLEPRVGPARLPDYTWPEPLRVDPPGVSPDRTGSASAAPAEEAS